MKRLLIAVAFFLGLASPALADEPWIAYGQALVPYNSRADNPPATKAGALGEVSLPYTVPEGYYLDITAFGVEAYNITGAVGLFPWLGPPPAANHKALHTAMCNDMTCETTGARYRLKPGTIVNISIMCTENPAQLVGWYISGTLIPIGQPFPSQ